MSATPPSVPKQAKLAKSSKVKKMSAAGMGEEAVPEPTLQWSVLEPRDAKMSARYGHTVVERESAMYVFGGDGTARLNSVHKYDIETNSLQEVPTKGERPSARSGNTAVEWQGSMYVFGGRDANTHFGDIYELNLGNRRWTKVEPVGDARCPARYRHSAITYNGSMYVFGGEIGGEGGNCYNDLYEFNFVTRAWTLRHTSGQLPPPRSAHSAVTHEENGTGYMLVYGGRNKDKSSYFRDLYRCNLRTGVWTQITNATGETPPATYDHAAASYRDSFFIWGGYGSEGDTGPGMGKRQDVLYEYNMSFNRWYLVETKGDMEPSARLGHTLTVVRDRLYLLGGWDRNGYCSDLNMLKLDDYMMDVRSLLLHAETADVFIHVGDDERQLHANLAILYARVPLMIEYLEEHGEWRDEKLYVELKDVSYEAFYDFLMFVYTGDLQFSPKYMVDVWVLSKRFGLKRAMGLCITAILKNLNVNNVLFILQSAHRSDVGPVKAYCQQFVMREFEQVAHSEAMNELDKELIVELVRLQATNPRRESDEDAPASPVPRRLTDVNEFDVIPDESLKVDLLRLVGNPKYADIQFSLEGNLIPAHSCIVGRCPAFRVMFASAMREGVTRIVELNDVHRVVFDSFLRYVYGSFLSIKNLNNALELLTLADRFLLEPLKRLCGEYITASGSSTGLLNHNNIFVVLEIADQCRLVELKKVAVDYIARNFHAVCKSKYLKRFSQDLLVEIIHKHASVCTTIEESMIH